MVEKCLALSSLASASGENKNKNYIVGFVTHQRYQLIQLFSALRIQMQFLGTCT
jgi:hypothetical protein